MAEKEYDKLTKEKNGMENKLEEILKHKILEQESDEEDKQNDEDEIEDI